ncbi:enolase 4-like isoform X2 [Lineus longissimus]|uniref:enolase 4-like isoform X2 n=1 Tax=Lineus longissimus TaxID=88925 RepID=UPI00315CEACA
MMSSRNASREARALFELKQRAVHYYKENGVPEKMEEIMNAMFYDDPHDVYGHLSNYFETFSKAPVITRLKAREALDSKGQPTIQTQVYCLVKNFEKCLASSISSSVNRIPESGKPEDRDTEDTERQEFVTAAIDYINGEFTDKMKELDPLDQAAVDEVVYGFFDQMRKDEEKREVEEKENAGEGGDEVVQQAPAPTPEKDKKAPKSPKGKGKAPAIVIIPEEPLEKLYPGCNAVAAVSTCVCLAGAAVKRVQLYEHIVSLRRTESTEKYRLPLPMVTILQSGKVALGKQNCVKEYMVVPKPGVMTMKESVKNIRNIYNTVQKNLSAKAGAGLRNVSDSGAICPTFDRPEQGMDLIQDAWRELNFIDGEFNIVLNLAGHEIFDYEKGKYEPVTGQQKMADDMVDFWVEILNRYPSVIGIIDPIRKQDKEQWMKICEKVSERCLIIGDYVFHRPGLLKDDELPVDFQTSAIIVRMESMTSVSHLIELTKKMQEAQNEVILASSLGESPDMFLTDLAVGLGAKFLKMGAPCRGERVNKLNRLVEIEECLLEADQLDQWGVQTFPKLELPAPPSEDDQVSEGATDERKPEDKS